jgi:hypothetical protein
MSRSDALRAEVRATPEERRELAVAFNYPGGLYVQSLFEPRLIMVRRAVRAGYYTEHAEPEEAEAQS